MPKTTKTCSFCRTAYKTAYEVLVEGPEGANICKECISIANAVVAQEREEHHAGRQAPKTTPSEVRRFLDQYVIGQEEAKITLAVAVHNHYKKLRHDARPDQNVVELDKSNILMIGPTGSGKTLLAQCMARILKVPFAIADATTLTETGYVGDDVESILFSLLQDAGGDVALAEHGIVYIDEIDKIARTSHNVSITRDVSGEGVQQGLLKLLEGTVARIQPQRSRKHSEQDCIQLDTSNILFICGGTFSGLANIIQRRKGKACIGFANEGISHDAAVVEESHLLDQVAPGDLVKFGLIPELVGRLPVFATLQFLDTVDLVTILQEPKNALVKQYQQLFEYEGVSLEFTESAMSVIAELAEESETGARGLRRVMDNILRLPMYELPDRIPPQKLVVTAAVVRGESALLPEIRSKRKSA